jgi:Protein of unknown function (DUF3515)
VGDSKADSEGPPRAALIAALAVAIGAIGVIFGIAVTRHPPLQPVAIPTVPAPHAQDPACRALLEALPQRLGNYQRAPTVQPTPAGTAAWRAAADAEPVVLRCGLDRPADFVVGSPLQLVDQVQWFNEADRRSGEPPPQAGGVPAGPGSAPSRSTWYAVDRPVYVALTLPSGSGPTPIQQLSELIDQTMPAVPIRPSSG